MPQALKFGESVSDTPVLQPYSLLPEQFFGSFRRRTASRTGEYRLLVAVLEEAILCFRQNAFATTARQKRLFLEVEQWVMAASFQADGYPPRFSFDFICAVLDIDADYLRRGLRRWRDAQMEHGRVESLVGARSR